MERDAKLMRGSGPTVFAQVKNGEGVDEIINNIHDALKLVDVQPQKKSKRTKK